MCEANVYIRNQGEEDYQLLLEAVDKVIPCEEGIKLESIFGERKLVRARINELRLVDHEICLERL